MQTFRLVPVSEHPIFPGSSASLSLTESQYQTLKHVNDVFATVVKNDKLLEPDNGLMEQLMAQSGRRLSQGLPEITHANDIYSIGSLCSAKAIHDKHNAFSPYLLNLYPQHRARITTFLDPVAPLA